MSFLFDHEVTKSTKVSFYQLVSSLLRVLRDFVFFSLLHYDCVDPGPLVDRTSLSRDRVDPGPPVVVSGKVTGV